MHTEWEYICLAYLAKGGNACMHGEILPTTMRLPAQVSQKHWEDPFGFENNLKAAHKVSMPFYIFPNVLKPRRRIRIARGDLNLKERVKAQISEIRWWWRKRKRNARPKHNPRYYFDWATLCKKQTKCLICHAYLLFSRNRSIRRSQKNRKKDQRNAQDGQPLILWWSRQASLDVKIRDADVGPQKRHTVCNEGTTNKVSLLGKINNINRTKTHRFEGARGRGQAM